MGYDVCSAEPDFVLTPGEQRFVSSGFEISVGGDLDCQLRPRSGLATNERVILLYSPCTIDPDYQGKLIVPLWNVGPKAVPIPRGSRIAQLVFSFAVFPEVVEVADFDSKTKRGSNGFGSTGLSVVASPSGDENEL